MAGGYTDREGKTNYSTSSSLYIPSKQIFCDLPNIPTHRQGHTTQEFTVCGGFGDNDDPNINLYNCDSFDVDTGSWYRSFDFTERHAGYVSWQTSQGLMLIGGWHTDKTSILFSNGTETKIVFESDKRYRTPCGIPDPETGTIVITGGSSDGVLSKRVTRYDEDGKGVAMPDMNIPRYLHGCSSYTNGGGKKVRQFCHLLCPKSVPAIFHLKIRRL